VTSTRSIPIISYHAIQDGPGPVCLQPRDFERQIRALHEAGCTTLRVDEVVRLLRSGSALPPRPVALTFDDAYASVHTMALPLLASLDMTATVFPVTSELGGHNRWDAAKPGIPRLALVETSQLLELRAAGWEVGSHTHTHAALRSIPKTTVESEIETSISMLEDICGAEVRTFAYPYGLHDATSRQVVASRYEVGLDIGAAKATTSSPLDCLPRVDAWYLRRTWQVRGLHGTSGDLYLAVRRLGRAIGHSTGRGRGG